MNIRKLRNVSGCAALVVAGLGISHQAHGQIAVNGSYDPAFGTPLSYAEVPTSAGDSVNGNTIGHADGTEIDASYATIRANQQGVPTLYMFFAGNLSSGLFWEYTQQATVGSTPLGDFLNVFIQTGTGGLNTLAGAGTLSSADKFQHMVGTVNPIVFDSTFSPNYRLGLQNVGGSYSYGGGGPGDTDPTRYDFELNYGNLNTNTNIYEGNVNPGGHTPEPLSSSGGAGGGSAQGINFNINNSNTLGVTGTTVPSQAALAAITTGITIQMPLADITEAGQSLGAGSPIKIGYLVMQGNNNPNNAAGSFDDDIYNQTTNLAPGYTDYTGLSSSTNNTNVANGGSDSTVTANAGNSNDLALQPGGNHYFTINNVANLTWNNAGGSGDGMTWNAAAQNFNNGTSVSTYSDGSLVTFNDANNSNYAVTLNTTVNPGSVTFNSAGNYTVSGTGGITGAAAVEVISTAQDQNGGGAAGTITLSTVNSYTGGTYVGSGTLVVGKAGALPANSKLSIGQTGLESGQTVFATSAVVQLAPNTGGETLTSLTINPANLTEGLMTGSQLDITNNHVFINYGSGTDPINTIRTEIINGYNGGSWNGNGVTIDPNTSAPVASSVGAIISTNAQTNGASYGIGYADSADPGNPAGLAAGTVEIMYTLLGDANLDGAVNGTDFALLAMNFNKAVSGWDQGDFNYDGAANGTDFALLAGNFNKGASQSDVDSSDAAALASFASANGISLSSVPEPASIGLAAMGIVTVLGRRRRRN